MKTPTEVSLERITKAGEQLAKAMGDLSKALKEQNIIIAQAVANMNLPPQYKDVEISEPNEKDSK